MSSLLTKIMHHIVRFCYPYLKDIELEHTVAKMSQLRSQFKMIGKYCNFGPSPIIGGAEFMSVGDNLRAGKGLRLEAIKGIYGQEQTPELIIGDDVSFEDWCHIGCIGKVIIGKGTLIASKVFISDHFHGSITNEDIGKKPGDRPLSYKPVIIGENVWIGEGVSILPGVTIGDNVIIGANSVVTHSFPKNNVIAGCPAKLIKSLSQDENN